MPLLNQSSLCNSRNHNCVDHNSQNIWYVCKFCKRAYILPKDLMSHKRYEHRDKLKIERKLKKLSNRESQATAASVNGIDTVVVVTDLKENVTEEEVAAMPLIDAITEDISLDPAENQNHDNNVISGDGKSSEAIAADQGTNDCELTEIQSKSSENCAQQQIRNDSSSYEEVQDESNGDEIIIVQDKTSRNQDRSSYMINNTSSDGIEIVTIYDNSSSSFVVGDSSITSNLRTYGVAPGPNKKVVEVIDLLDDSDADIPDNESAAPLLDIGNRDGKISEAAEARYSTLAGHMDTTRQITRRRFGMVPSKYGPAPAMYKCSQCSYAISDTNWLSLHVRSAHPPGQVMVRLGSF